MKVLIADDDPVSRRLLEVTLNNFGYDTVLASDGAEALRIAERPDTPRLIVLDWVMPEMDGVEVCKRIRRFSGENYFYIILLTVKGRQNDVVEGLDSGADDYITKPFDLHELKARLRAGSRILELQQQLISSRDRLRFEASHDAQTELLNHGAIVDILRKEVLRAQRERSSLGIIMVDLDYFKAVNDQYGHMGGDALLQEVARRLKTSVRPYDSVGRYGGEEFLVVAPGCGSAASQSLAERLRHSIHAQPIEYQGKTISVSASFGVSCVSGSSSADDLLRSADEALYRAKVEGRNRVVLDSPRQLVSRT